MRVDIKNLPVKFPAIVPFHVPGADEKEQALKVLEEASELVEAVKEKPNSDALYEFCDVLQAMGNLACLMGWTHEDMVVSGLFVFEQNFARGRYAQNDESGDEVSK